MPSITDATNVDLSGYKPAQQDTTSASTPNSDLQPGLNSMLRCPLPPIFQASPDSLRQFYTGNKVPQTRLLSPVTSNGQNGGGGSGGNAVIQNVQIVNGGGGGTTPSGPALPPVGTQASVTTPVLNPGDQFIGSIQMAKGFQLLSATASTACRIELYGNQSSQSFDLYRAIDVAPPAGTVQGLITDIVLDTTPYQWFFQNRVGANSDTPQKTTLYITVTNIGQSSTPITVSVQYVPLES